MGSAVSVDSHIHLFYTPEESLWYADYELWEYGNYPQVAMSDKMAKPGCASHLNYVDDVVDSLNKSGFDKGLVLNIFPGDILKQNAISALPDSLSPSARESAILDIDVRVREEMVNYNIEACRRLAPHPQLHSFVSVDPTGLGFVNHYAMLDAIKNDHGAFGIKMHHVLYELAADDPKMDSIYQASMDLGMAIVAHCGRSQGHHQPSDPNAFYGVLKKFPYLKLVIAHVGGSSWQQTVRVAQAFPNVAFDICEIIEWIGAPNAPSPKQLAQLIKDVGVDRVFLGSDYPWYDIDHTLEQLMRLPLLSHEEKQKILGENAVRFFGL